MPAAAVIPAPVAYIKVAAVKKLVVGFLQGQVGPLFERVSKPAPASLWGVSICLIAYSASRSFYFEENRVLTAGQSLEYISME